ncbi:CIC11C00000000648 [Sungouiella intermedia]|uniref:CIC11C00000000648 n=1 Tax=Sungouiella intermedia TaxID=45354 RepID=A0A1L0D937_9ASCO|nr:CIC11C00000000648 [[Candida] intermedia]
MDPKDQYSDSVYSVSPELSQHQKRASDDLLLKQPEKHMSYRESYSLEISHGSLHLAEIGQAVPVHVFDGKDARVRSRTDASFDDDMSLISESQVHLGRLNTIKGPTSSLIVPEYTVNTAVENVIPPRLRRRPVSEIISLRPKETTNHQHRFSLNISDDLDKIMESANDLQHKEEGVGSSNESQESGPESAPESVPENVVGHSRLNSMLSTESFETAGDGRSTTSLTHEHKETTVPMVLPKRPNPDNLERARQASHQFSTGGSIALQENTVSQDMDDLVNSVHPGTLNALVGNIDGFEPDVEGLVVQEYPSNKLEAEVATASGKSDQNIRDINERGVYSLGEDNAPNNDKTPTKIESDDFQSTTLGSSNSPGSNLGQSSNIGQSSNLGKSIDEQALQTPSKEATKPMGTITPGVHNPVRDSLAFSLTPDLKELGQPVDLRHANSQSLRTEKELPPPPGTLLAQSEITPGKVGSSVYARDTPGDDGFYDIEDPVIVSKPVRSKSVKDSIQNPKRKTSKRKSSRKKARDASNFQLKPFSYNTLIHLLESVNGTVIGEEFESLNLPIQEKQMIEKIVDSLSRLTLDMVIDENRYDVGMERLEKAHRVLEGFL